MLNAVDRITYRVNDLEKAKDWYQAVLQSPPILDCPAAAAFAVGTSIIILMPVSAPGTVGGTETFGIKTKDAPVVYWSVTDIGRAYKRLLEYGASPHSEICRHLFDSLIANVVDPFGNVIGITMKKENGKRSLEEQPSETAMTAVFCRALAALDEREEIRGKDSFAEIFLTEEGKRPIRDPAARAWVMKNLMRGGVYEYFIARTAYLDGIVEGALRDGIPQLVFLGAGYDSRPYRFTRLVDATRIFEVDAEPTQKRKRRLLDEARIPVPGDLTYVPLDFEKDKLADALIPAGYDTGKRTLFIWEGVSYYLTPEASDETLRFVKENSAAGSEICFDYLLDAPDLESRNGAKEVLASMKAMYENEKLLFRIPEGEAEAFMKSRGFSLLEHFTPADLERTHLHLRDGSSAGKIAPLFCLARAASDS